MNSHEASFTILKGRFKATASSSFGLFEVFIDNSARTVDRFDVVASHFSTVYENNVLMPWNELEDLISKMKWKGEFATSLTHDIKSSLEDLFDPGSGRLIDILNAIKRSQLNKINTIFEEALGRPSGDKAVKVEILVEVVSISEMEDVKRMREQNESGPVLAPKAAQDPSELSGIEASAVVLDVSLELSPVSGKQIMELQAGEKILVKIVDKSGKGQYFTDLLNANVDGKIIPIPATVEKVVSGAKTYTVMVSIGPGVYGKAVNEDNIKVKLYTPGMEANGKVAKGMNTPDFQMADPTTLSHNEIKEEKNFATIMFVIGGVAGLLILMLIYFMFF